MATVVGVCSKDVKFGCGDTTGGSAGGRPEETKSSDGISVSWAARDGDRQMGEVAASTFTTFDVASIATVVMAGSVV